VLVTAGLGPPLGGRTLRRVEQDGAWRTPFVPPERPAGHARRDLLHQRQHRAPKGVEHGDASLVAQAELIGGLYGMGPTR
jgi:hypothetical protein